jgi:hypothetical protein
LLERRHAIRIFRGVVRAREAATNVLTLTGGDFNAVEAVDWPDGAGPIEIAHPARSRRAKPGSRPIDVRTPALMLHRG